MNTLLEKAISIDCLIQCLSAVDTDNIRAMQSLPEALKMVSEKVSELVQDIEKIS